MNTIIILAKNKTGHNI